MKAKAVEVPAQGASFVTSLPQPPARNAEEYLRAHIGYVYTAVGAISQEVASIDLHLYKTTFVKNGKPKTSEIFEHPALSVLSYVNQIATFYDIVEATQTYLELTGEAFWVMLKDSNGEPTELWLLRPDWVKVIPHPTKVIDHYNYYAGGVMSEKVEIPKENIIPFKYFHPLNPYRGKGATQAAALPFDILNFAQEYNRNFFFNSAIPSLIFTTDAKISEQTSKRFLNQWQSTFGGRSKSNKIAFLGNGLKLEKASFGAKELDFTEQMKQMRDDVLAVFKVPKTVLGLTEDVNRANADATTRAFMERVITPRMRKFVDTLNEFFLPAFTNGDNSLFLDFTDPSPEDVELKLKRYENGRTNNWLTPNEIRVEENLPPLPGGDDLFNAVPNTTPAKPDDNSGDNSSDPNTPDSGDETDKPTGDEAPKGFRASIIKMFGGQVPVKEKKYIVPSYLSKEKPVKHMVNVPVKRAEVLKIEKMAGEFVAPLTKFISKLIAQDDYSPFVKTKKKDAIDDQLEEIAKKAVADSLSKKKIKENSNWTEEQKVNYWNEFIKKLTTREANVQKICQDLFADQEKQVIANLEDQLKAWRKRLGKKATPAQIVPSLEELSKLWSILTDVFKQIYIDQGNDTLDELGQEGDINLTTEFAAQYLIEYSGLLIKQINETTRFALMQELADGFDQGESIGQLKKRIQSVFLNANDVRAEMIARTEVIKASNAASVEGYRQSGVVTAKEWLAERDGRTCPLCLDLDGKAIELSVNYFDKGDEVTVDGQKFTFEYTDVGEPPAHVDCRCTTIPVLKD